MVELGRLGGRARRGDRGAVVIGKVAKAEYLAIAALELLMTKRSGPRCCNFQSLLENQNTQYHPSGADNKRSE
jgi:hypothetical protein